jgi:hypothetical protein
MLFGGLADDNVGQACGEGRGDNEGNGTELDAGEPLYSTRYLCRQRVGHVAQEIRFCGEEILVHIVAAALAAGEHEVPFQ